MEVVVVNSDVVLPGEEVPQSRKVFPLVREGAGMDVAKKLPDIPIGSSVTEKGIVVENDGLASHADGHLLGNMDETPHEALLDLLHVVVPEDEVDFSIQTAKNIIPFPGASECEIPQVEDYAIRWNSLVPVPDQGVVHLGYILEGAGAKLQNILVVEVRVRSEPDLVRLKGAKTIYHTSLSNSCRSV